MPTIIALDVSLSMTCAISESDETSYHKLAVHAIKDFLNYLSTNSKLEFVALVTFSSTCSVIVDYTRDYEIIRQALKKVEHVDKVNYEDLLQTTSNSLSSNWGTQCLSQVLVFTDCGLGFGNNSLTNMINNIVTESVEAVYPHMQYLQTNKLNFICIGFPHSFYFDHSIKILRKFLKVSEIKGNSYSIKSSDSLGAERSSELNKGSISEVIERLCEENYKPFESSLKCGGYFRLECPITLWPPPQPYKPSISQTVMQIAKRIEVCGYIAVSDVGSPASLSRHLILPKTDMNDRNKKENKTDNSINEFEKLETDIRAFYTKGDGNASEEEESKSLQSDSYKENVVVLLHGALKVENKAALVLLNDNWYGFIYSYADTKKKCNLMLSVLPPGNKVVPWLGDFRNLGLTEDLLPGENASFPVKSEKRSYSQNIVVWIKSSALNSDLQKVLRHAKKLPEKTPHFYKELNRIRRAALALGFIELLDTLAILFEKEVSSLPQNVSPDCSIQLRHAAEQLRKNRDFKSSITALPTKYNQLQ